MRACRVALIGAWVVGIGWLPGCLRDDIEVRFEQGLELLYQNRHEDAESHFLSIARDMDRSERPDAAAWRAKALFQVGRIDHLYLDQPRRAVGRLREALKVDPDAPFAFEARSEVASIFQDRLMDYRTAALEFERLVHEYPDRQGIDGFQYRVAQSYFLVRDFDQSRTEARMLLSKWPNGKYASEARLLIANSYYLENRLDEAVKAHRELLDTGPDIPIRARSLFELGVCYQDLGDKDRAEDAYLSALKDHPRPDLVQMQLAALRSRIDQEDESAKPLSYASSDSGAKAPEPKPVKTPAAKPDTPAATPGSQPAPGPDPNSAKPATEPPQAAKEKAADPAPAKREPQEAAKAEPPAGPKAP